MLNKNIKIIDIRDYCLECKEPKETRGDFCSEACTKNFGKNCSKFARRSYILLKRNELKNHIKNLEDKNEMSNESLNND